MRQKCKSRPKTRRQACLLSNSSKQYLASTLTLSKRSCAWLPAQREGLSEVMNKTRDLGTCWTFNRKRREFYFSISYYWLLEKKKKTKSQNQKPQLKAFFTLQYVNVHFWNSYRYFTSFHSQNKVFPLPGRDLHVLRSAGLCSSASCLWLVWEC